MKKILLMLFIIPGSILPSYGQAPQQFNYQAVARDASNQPYQNTHLGVRISLLKNDTSGEIEYSEWHDVTTTDLGVFTLKIGKGTTISGNFSEIEWGNNTYYLNVALDPEGGTDYIPMGSSQLLSVPYALYANQAGGGDSDNDPANEIQTLSLNGTVLTLEHGNAIDLSAIQDGVNDADTDPVNEIQELTLTGDSLLLSNGGGTVRLPTGTTYSAGTGISIAGNTITNTGDDDNSAANELQSLSISGNALSISDGNSVFLPNAASHWTKVGENLFYDSGSVNISKNLITEGIFRLFPDSSSTSLAVIQQGSEGAGEIITRGPNGSINTRLSNDTNNPNLGAIGVFNGNGNLRAGLSIDSIGRGVVTAHILDANSAVFDPPQNIAPIVANVDGNTKFQVHNNGGVSVGSSASPPANGLAVEGEVLAGSLETESAIFNAPVNVDPIRANVGADTKFRVHANGGVSIGSGTIPSSNDLFVFGGKISLSYEYIKVDVPNEIIFSGNLLPQFVSGQNLGSATYQWSNVYAINGIIQTSDLREKKNVQDLDYGLKELMQLRPVRYEWKSKPYSDPKLGLIAQEILPLIPEVVQTHEWKYGEDENAAPERVELDRLGVYYSDLIPVLIKAIQEQQTLIETQQTQLNQQQKEINNLKVRLE